MSRDTELDELPELSRRDALGFLGVASVSIPGLIATFDPETIVGLPRAEGDPVSVERTITDEGIDYRPASDTVKWSRTAGGTGPYTTEPFEKWARRRVASVGSEAVVPTIQDRVDKEVTGIGTGVSDAAIGTIVTVSIGTTYDPDGDVISEPNVSLEELAGVTPRNVRSTITLEGRKYTRSVPVFIEEGDVHED